MKMKMYGAMFLLANAMVISAVAIFVSIYGMISLFAAHALVVAIMIGSIEVGKLSAATWLKFNWSNKSIGIIHKLYLLIAIFVVSILTAIGCFGFLSAGHLEQNAPLAGLSIQSQQFQVQLDQTMAANKRVESRLAQIDTNINAFLTAGSATKGLRASDALKKERETLQAQMDENNKQINALNAKLAPLKKQSSEVEAKLGPVKYLASAMGYSNPETAVNIVILLIMIAFDPLAVVLIISAMATFKQIDDARHSKTIVNPQINIELPVNNSQDDMEILGSANINIEPSTTITGDAQEFVRLIEGDIPITISSDGIIEPTTPKPLSPRQIADQMAVPTVDPIPDDPKEIKNLLIDLMEQYPDIVNDLIATAKEMDTEFSPTTSNTTGATVD